MPRVSVIMGVYNNAQTLEASIASILSQTYTDWEFVICDDGSKDASWDILQRYASDPRIVLLKNETNMGHPATLNRCLFVSKGEWIARHDADDIANPDRLALEIHYLDDHPLTDVLGAWATLVDETGKEWGELTPPIHPTISDWARGSCLVHPSVVMKRSVLKRMGGYDRKAIRLEDYELWMRMVSQGVVIENMPERVMRYRLALNDYSKKAFKHRMRETVCRFRGLLRMKASPLLYLYVVRPLAIGILPNAWAYRYHQWKLRRTLRQKEQG